MDVRMDADSSRAPGLTSGLQGSVNAHRGALLLVQQWQCISYFVFYIYCEGDATFSSRDVSRNAHNRHWWRFMVDTGIWSKIWGSPLTNIEWHSAMIIYNDKILLVTLYKKPWSYNRSRPFTECWEVSIEQLRRAWHADRGPLLLRTSGIDPCWTCICSTCWDQSFSRNCRYLFGLCTSNVPRYFLDFAWRSCV